MPVAFRSVATAKGYGSTATVNKPAGVAVGDALIIVVSVAWADQTLATPSGFTKHWDNARTSYPYHRQAGFHKTAGSSEPASYSFQVGASEQAWTVAMLAYTGVSTDNPGIAPSTMNYNAGTANPYYLGTPPFNNSFKDAMILHIASVGSDYITQSVTVPSGITNRVNEFGQGNGSTWVALAISESYMAEAGTDPGRDFYFPIQTGGTRTTIGVGASIVLKSNQAPNTPTNLQRTGSSTDATPNFSADVLDPDTNQNYKTRFEIYQNDGTTLVGSVESAFRTGGGTATAEYASALPLGNYKVRAKSIDSLGLESAWTSMVNFSVTTNVTKDNIYLWNVNEQAVKNLVALWDVEANNAKQVVLRWDVLETLNIDLVAPWNVRTAWIKVVEPSSTWTKVGEL